ncbi:MAG TPA: hypothetical protein VGC05_11475 [Mycobacterium sp.]
MFNAIADHAPDLAAAGAPERLRSPFINGIKHWQVDYQGALPLPRRAAIPSGCTSP